MTSEWQIGEEIQNRWEILKILQGGMGIVYIVYDHQWNTIFAAKTFQDRYVVWQEMLKRFVDEAYIWINLDIHQHIVRAAMVKLIMSKPFLFLEYVAGGDLSRWIGTPKLDLKQTLKFAIQFCYGIEHAYSKGIKVHRDIKPTNCLVTETATLKITDFGLAKVFDDIPIDNKMEIGDFNNLQLGAGYSSTSRVVGTPIYMAPEQFLDAKNVNFHADIYSFGVMLYEMAVGEPPFQGHSWKDLERAHKTQPMPSLPRESKSMEWIIEKCLQKIPKERYSSFEKLRKDLVKLYETITCEAAPVPLSGRKLEAADWINKGFSFGELDFYEEMLMCCNRALELDPQIKEGWNNKGLAHAKLGQHKEAVMFFNQALEIDPRSCSAWNNKGLALFDLNRNEEALNCYNKVLEINPKIIQAWSNITNVLQGMGRTEEVIEYYNRATEINPESDEIWNNKGKFLRELGRNDEALVCYNRAIEINPHDNIAWYNKGNILLSLERLKEALNCYNMALKIDPILSHAWVNKGVVLLKLGNHQEALTCLEPITKLTPKSLDDKWLIKSASENLGNLYKELGDLHGAIFYFDQALTLLHDIGDRIEVGKFLFKLGDAHYSLSNIRYSIKLFEQSLEIMQENDERYEEVVVLRHLGTAYNSLGNVRCAIEYSKKSLDLAKEIGDVEQIALANLNLSLILLEQNQRSEALVNAELALENFKQFGNEQDVLQLQQLIDQFRNAIK